MVSAGRVRVGDQAAVGDRVRGDRLLEQPVEQRPAPPGVTSVEAERELVEVRVELHGTDRALVGPSSQRCSRLTTRCTPGITTCAGSFLLRITVRSCV